jgi:hypothetical protein
MSPAARAQLGFPPVERPVSIRPSLVALSMRRGTLAGLYPTRVTCREVEISESRYTIAFAHGKLVDEYLNHDFGPYVDRYTFSGKGRIWQSRTKAG